MALDPFLFGTYKQYKAGTNKVMTWLASRARETNLLSNLFPTESANKGKGRLKGKARAAKKETSEKHHVPLTDIPRIAESIASTKKTMAPNIIIRTLEEVIAARSACNKQQGQKDPSTQASNQKHQYFIEVLRETLRILEPLSRTSDQTKGTKAKADSTGVDKGVASLRNRFNYLEVDEPTEWTSSALPSKSNKVADTYKLEPTDDDISFAIFCLLKDLTDIRHYWAEYREHQIAFTTAALTMNTAISIFRRLNEEFISKFPQFDDHGVIIDYVYDGYRNPNCPDRGRYPKDSKEAAVMIMPLDPTMPLIIWAKA
ncbi:hypothetical protein G7Y89_g2936 [Cudoniella acicularis]|uniref:DUF6604 domain-containing protein n=1 Tax=Cudoniella acicularis TaxID=354080 RepID=A0A8H4RSE2_9HELO|nr:hypothetical protein G7Y89_g2936 [Cudoniella acicularis]